MSGQIAAEVCQVNIGPNDDFVKGFKEVESFFKASTKKWVFRGYRDSTRRLISSLEHKERENWEAEKANWLKGISKKEDNKEALSAYLQEQFDKEWQTTIKCKEMKMITRFKDLLHIDNSKDFRLVHYLAIMQHYGVPTRLMDVTEEIGYALYFASEKEDKGDGRVVWAIQTDSIESHSTLAKAYLQNRRRCKDQDVWNYVAEGLFKSDDMTSVSRRQVVPVWMSPNNQRMNAQKGLFIMSQHIGNGEYDFFNTILPNVTLLEMPQYSVEKFLSLSEEVKRKIAAVKIIYDNRVNNTARQLLNIRGIKQETIYPDLRNSRDENYMNFCKDVREEFGY